MRCIILPYGVATGPANMALDASLLEQVARTPDAAFLRTYGWTEPTLSLGYFQRLADATAEDRWKDVPVVRRPTGGGAIWHDHELTYAVILPTRHGAAHSATQLYQAVHGCLSDLLRDQGIEIRRRGASLGVESSTPRPFLCFKDRDPEDLVSADAKLVGSAQRRSKGAILQHGSILLRASDRTPELPGVCELGGPALEPREWAELVLAAVVAALELEPVASDVSADVEQRAGELERLVYRDEAWTGRR